MLMKTVQLPSAPAYYSQIVIHTSTSNTDISLARKFQKHPSDPTCTHGLLDHSKDRKLASKQKWNEREYLVQDRKYVSHILVKMSCTTTQFPEL